MVNEHFIVLLVIKIAIMFISDDVMRSHTAAFQSEHEDAVLLLPPAGDLAAHNCITRTKCCITNIFGVFLFGWFF